MPWRCLLPGNEWTFASGKVGTGAIDTDTFSYLLISDKYIYISICIRDAINKIYGAELLAGT